MTPRRCSGCGNRFRRFYYSVGAGLYCGECARGRPPAKVRGPFPLDRLRPRKVPPPPPRPGTRPPVVADVPLVFRLGPDGKLHPEGAGGPPV